MDGSMNAIAPKVQNILDIRVSVDDGTKAPAVILDQNNASPAGRFFCLVCSATIPSVPNLMEHVKGGRHTRFMKKTVHSAKNFLKHKKQESAATRLAAQNDETGVLVPGEPVPPGFEDLVSREPQIMGKLNVMKAHLIGLEYVAEIVPADEEQERRYVCLLCDKKGDPRTVMAHMICFNHRIRFVKMFFPKTYAAFQAIPKDAEYRRGTGEILTRVAKAIEAKFGRAKPLTIDEVDFETKRATLIALVGNPLNCHESPTSSYEKLVDLESIRELSETKATLKSEEESAEAKFLSASIRTAYKHVAAELERRAEENSKKDEESAGTGNNGFQKREPAPAAKRRYRRSVSPLSVSSRSRSRSSSRSRSNSRDRYRYRKSSSSRSRLPYRKTRSRSRSRSPSRNRYHRRRSPSYRRSPRRSRSRSRSPVKRRPLYGRSVPVAPQRTTVSFQIKPTPSLAKDPELERHRAKFAKFREISKSIREEMAQQLKTYEKTPEKHPVYSEEWKKFWNKRYKELTAEGKDASKHDFKPEWIKYWTVRLKQIHDSELNERLQNERKELGLPDEDDVSDDDFATTSKTSSKEKKNNSHDDDIEMEDAVTVIGALRVLTALEDQLGSLGPRINSLLSQALGLERRGPGQSETLLDNLDNCVLFDTAKEKLKGQLFAGVIPKHHVPGTKKAVSTLVDLLLANEKRQKNKEKERKFEMHAMQSAPVALAAEPVVVPGVGVVDKFAIAEEIAAALCAQGRTDVTDEELGQLVIAIVGMSQAQPAQVQAKPAQQEKSSNLQDLLSSVVKAHKAQAPSSGLQLLQGYDDPPPPKKRLLQNMDVSDLSENDLKALLQNFNDLSRDEQQCLIAYLKKLESKDAASVNKLRSYINLTDDEPHTVEPTPSGRLSPFSLRQGNVNPTREKKTNSFEDDEDYSDEDIVVVAKKNVKDERAAKKVAGKQAVIKMIEEQEKRAAEVTIGTASKSQIVIDPHDLFSGFNEPVSAQEPAEVPPVATLDNDFPLTSSNPPSSVVTPPATTSDTVMSLPATSLGHITAPPINPAPPAGNGAEAAEWASFDYSNPPPTYQYQDEGSYNNFNDQVPTQAPPQTDQYQVPVPGYEPSWSDQQYPPSYNYPPPVYDYPPGYY